MNGYLIAIAALALGFLACSGVSLAQDEEDLDYCWGVVSSVSADQIIVTEYDYDSHQDVDVVYTLERGIEFKGVVSPGDIEVGDDIEIDYLAKGNKKIARIITIEKAPREEYTPSEIYYEEESGQSLE